jgi:arsenical pump membrane protein
MHAFLLPSVLAISVTFGALYALMRRRIPVAFDGNPPRPRLGRSALFALICLAATSIVLLAASARGLSLGVPTAIVALATMVVVVTAGRKSPWTLLGGISWPILPLVAGLFAVVEAVTRTGVVSQLATVLRHAADRSPAHAAALAGGTVAIAGNLINNLPAGLIARSTLVQAHAPALVTHAIMIGVDLGPNLSITGSLATILWLTALRREGEEVSYGTFLRIGLVVMPLSVGLALAARILIG